ncbi:tyrosine-type recombinase/integrase [Pseudonocardia nigra]|uniref:tyrosine-type recombinase/integrase n=1 Tax=Pseudonocardia nigra TaxID=1921578 RepID=UPI0027E314C5|nr:tyrosine-type recombinase/integrase [Pseudonocardia nigra]
MAKKISTGRSRGHIRQRGNSFQVLVYAGNDPLTGKEIRLTASAKTEAEAKAILKRFRAQVDEQRQAKTNATFRVAMDAWLRTHDVEETTRASYEQYARVHLYPAFGDEPIGKVTARLLEEFYAELRRCSARCDGRPAIEHRTTEPHECRLVKHRRPPGRPPAAGYPAHDCDETGCTVVECRPHQWRPLSAATIRRIHFAVRGVLSAAERWEWITSNPAVLARKPRQPTPQPDPPTVAQAARIIDAAWKQDDSWGTLVWLVIVTGLRRAELLALRWSDVDLAAGVLTVRRNYVRVKRTSIEKDTKTHQMRRLALDPATVEVLTEHRERYDMLCRQVDSEPQEAAFLFSYRPAHDRPCDPSGVTHRYARMCAELGIDSHLHALRHYSATELLTAGVDLRTVAGRLGHGGGGATTLRVYAAWVGDSDRRASEILGGRMKRPRRGAAGDLNEGAATGTGDQ